MTMMNKQKVIKAIAMRPLWDGIVMKFRIYGDVIQLKKRIKSYRKWFLII